MKTETKSNLGLITSLIVFYYEGPTVGYATFDLASTLGYTTTQSLLYLDSSSWVHCPYLRPYLDIFKAPGSPCHELTSSDNSTSMRIWLDRKESQCEGILPVSLHRWHCQQHHISLALPQLSLWHTMKCKIKENLWGVPLLLVRLRNTI